MATTGKKPSKPRKKRKMTAGRLFVWIAAAGLVGAICAIGMYILIILHGQKYLMDHIDKLNLDEASIIKDADGNEVTKLYVQNRELVTLDEVPEKLRDAFIATEDRRFNSHFGIDIWSIGRALYRDIVHRGAVEGGSTITQQLAKNIFLDADKTLFRKVQEASIAIALENNFSKDEILEKYLNRIYFGNSAYGIKAAAQTYFGKDDLNKLTLAEMATLAGIPKSPGTYSPVDNPQKSKERRDLVLSLMAEQGYITEQEKEKAMQEPLVATLNKPSGQKDYLTFIDYVVKEAENVYGISEDELLRGGYQIYTTLNVKAQKAMENAYANDKLFQKDMNGDPMQSGMVIYNQKDGGIVAMIGGRDYARKGWNRAIQPRQPGSSFKPIVVYGPALESGKWNPYSTLKDEDMSFGNYHPQNYDLTYRGSVTMLEAVKKSLNVPAVWLLNQIGIDSGMKFAQKLGIPFAPEDRNLAIALGGMTRGVSPLQMARAYGAFANQGYLNKEHAIVKIVDTNGRQVAAFKPEKTQVMSAKTAYYMTQMLQAVVEPGGTGASARMNRPVAGKTGSTQVDIKGLEKYYRDIWFVGYTPEWTAAVWMGFDKTDSKHYVTMSSGGAAVLFKEVMSAALAGTPVTSFTKPPGVEDLAAPPKAVTDLKATLDQDGRAVLLSWSAAGDNVAYRLYRKGSKDQEFTMILPGEGTEIKDMTVQPGETYQYYVVAVNKDTDVESGKSNVVEIAVPAGQVLPGPLNPMPGAGNGGNPQIPPADGGAEDGTGRPGNGSGRPPAQDGTPGTTTPGTGGGQGSPDGTAPGGANSGTGQGEASSGTGQGGAAPGAGGQGASPSGGNRASGGTGRGAAGGTGATVHRGDAGGTNFGGGAGSPNVPATPFSGGR